MRTARLVAEPNLAVALVATAGGAAILMLAAYMANETPLALAGGAVMVAALAGLVAAGWFNAPLLVLLTLPLPAIYSTGSLRIATAAPVTAAVLGAWLLALAAAGQPIRAGRVPRTALALLIATMLLATVTAQHPLTSVREIINFGVLIGFLLLAVHAFSLPGALPRFIDALVALAAVCGFLAVLETVGIMPAQFPRYDLGYNRAALGFGQPNGLGLFFAIAIPFTVHRLRIERDRGRRLLCTAACALTAAGLIATFSRGAWLAVFGGTLIFFFTGDRRFFVRLWIVMLVGLILFDVSTGILRDTIQRSIGDWVIEQRAALMLAGIAMFLAYPITGVGPGGYAESLSRFGPQIPQLWDYLPTPHNAYVQMAAETGIIGLAAYIVFLLAVLRSQIRRTRRDDADPTVPPEQRSLNRALLWSFATVCAAGMVVWPFAHGTGQAVMLVMAGMFAVPGGIRRRTPYRAIMLHEAGRPA